MAWTSVGFDGTITEIQWAGLAGLLGNGYVAAGNGDCLVTAIGGTRSVSVAAGSLYGDGVLSTNSGAETVALTTPVNGQWYVIALRRTWATNTAALVAVAGATTTTTTPTAPPTSFPTLNTNVGVLTDQPIAWAWCNSANTTVVVFDIRLKAVKSLPPVVATAAERDAKFMSPTQGLQVWRDDLGAVETYYGLFNSSTNPGGRDTAGWYVNDRQTGLIPIKPTTVTITSGSGSANAIGSINFTNATGIQLDGVFSSKYRNYRLVFNARRTSSNASGVFSAKLAAGGTISSSGYSGGQNWVYYAASTVNSWDDGTMINITPVYYSNNAAILDIFDPYQTIETKFTGLGIGSQASNGTKSWVGGEHATQSAFDGIWVGWNSGTWTGTVQILGYNN
jgi:hypothetical protein